MGSRGHYLNTRVVSCECGALNGEETLGSLCSSCNTPARETTNTALQGRALPHPSIKMSYEISDEQEAALMDYLMEVGDHTSPIVRRMLMLEFYENTLAINNYDEISPLIISPLIRMNGATQLYSYSLLAYEMSRLVRLGIPSKTGMSVEALLDLPTEHYRLLVNSCLGATANKAMDMETIYNELDE